MGIIPQKMYVERLFLNSARRLVMLNISTKFYEIISNGIKVIEYSVLISEKWLVMLYICTKFREIISHGIKVIE